MKRSTHFTLIELLVVVTIIAILAGMLLPVFSTVQQKAKASNCVSKLKQIGVALKSYETDWRMMPYATYGWNVYEHNYGFEVTDYMATPRVVAVLYHWLLREGGYINNINFYLCPMVDQDPKEEISGEGITYAPNLHMFIGASAQRYPSALLVGDGYGDYRLRCRDWSFRFRHGNAESKLYVDGKPPELGFDTTRGNGNYLMADGSVWCLQAKNRATICRDLIARCGTKETVKNYYDSSFDHPNCGAY